MGDYLSSPVTEKASESTENDKFSCGASQMQGWRKTMEDAHVMQLDGDQAFLGVFDGHGGKEVAQYMGKNIYEELIKNDAFHNQQYELALKQTYLKMDELMRSPEGKVELDLLQNDGEATNAPEYVGTAGCSAICALVVGSTLYVANAGDSRAVLCRNGSAVALSKDHKPQDPLELNRILKAGGEVRDGRISGGLNLSRSCGDFDYKDNNSLAPEDQMVTANPEITVTELTDQDEFLILACDGVWDCLCNTDSVYFVKARLEKTSLSTICEEMFDRCISRDVMRSGGLGGDNMTAIILKLNGI